MPPKLTSVEALPPPDPAVPAAADPAPPLADYAPVALAPRHDGFSAARQRTFLTALAETGCVSHAAGEAGISARSAYRLRQRPEARGFAAAWDSALRLATLRLTAVAFERAIRGTVREIWREGELVGETRTPSDKLLIFLLQHLLPRGQEPGRLQAHEATVAALAQRFPAQLEGLADSEVALVPLDSRDFFAAAPGDPADDW